MINGFCSRLRRRRRRWRRRRRIGSSQIFTAASTRPAGTPCCLVPFCHLHNAIIVDNFLSATRRDATRSTRTLTDAHTCRRRRRRRRLFTQHERCEQLATSAADWNREMAPDTCHSIFQFCVLCRCSIFWNQNHSRYTRQWRNYGPPVGPPADPVTRGRRPRGPNALH